MVRWNPLAMARNASSTTTTSPTAITVASDSHSRCGRLLRLMAVTARICSKIERIGSAPAERGDDVEAHRVERRHQAGDEAEHDHQPDRRRRDVGV